MKLQIKKHKYKILLALFTISLISSLVLSLLPVSEICDPNVGCDVVHHSQYNFTFGIQNSYFGVPIFLILIVLTLWHIYKPEKFKKNLIHASVIVGSVIAIYFLYIQAFVLNAWCKYCLVVDVSLLLALVLIFWKWKK